MREQPCSQDAYIQALAAAKRAGLKKSALKPFAEKLRSVTLVSRLLEDSLMEALPTAVQKLAELFNSAAQDGKIGRYALAGGFAIVYYGAPIHTADADFLVVFPATPAGLLDPSSLFGYFEGKGATWDGEHLVFHGLKFQMIPANEGLNAEALATAVEAPDGFLVVDLEHLIAMKLAANRPKDLLHIEHLLASGARPDKISLEAVLRRCGLTGRWTSFLRRAGCQ